MQVGVPREFIPGERRVALVPDGAATLIMHGLSVVLEAGAGEAAGYADAAFAGKGAMLVSTPDELFATTDILLQASLSALPVTARPAVLERFRSGQIVVGLLNPLGDAELIAALAARGVTAFALELLPRITRAQSMDVLSSMATVAGYRAVLMAASTLPRFFPMFMTAAGTVTPARVFVIGAGVAGLQAIATSRRLGAVVHAYDVRAAVKQEVESLGAKFVELPLEAAEGAGGYARAMDEAFYARQRELMHSVVHKSDVVITTAAIPGKRAPVLVTREMVEAMPAGSVIVDLAAETGGNCELTRPGETVVAPRRQHSRAAASGGHAALPRQPDVLEEPGDVPREPDEERAARAESQGRDHPRHAGRA